jgi:putative PIN family toxin of toxin-antitoxin system
VRLLLDTDVIVAAMRSPSGGSAEILRQIDDGKAIMLLSVALALEYEAKSLMAEHRLAAGFTMAQAEEFVNGLISLAELVRSPYRWRPQLRDPGDELVLEAAVNGRASAIVTFNEKDLRNAKSSFGIDVIRPGEALRRISSWQQE